MSDLEHVTIADVRRKLTDVFAAAGLDTPALDARILLQCATGLAHAEIAASPDRNLASDEAERLAAFASRRLHREPVAYITGEREFWSLPLRVTRDTLIPRPDTEAVVEAALACMPADERQAPLRIADLGTGTGAILLALLSEFPHALGVGVDISAAAAEVARGNAARLDFVRRALFAVGDFTTPLGSGFDLVVSNPPYVEAGAVETLPAEVSRYEPRGALDGGPDGLTFYGRLAADAGRIVVPGGRVVVEVGDGQAGAVAALFGAAGWTPAGPAGFDLSGAPRALTFRQA